MEVSTIHSRLEQPPRNLPVFSACGEQVALDQCECGHGIAQNVGTPQQWDPVVKNDGRGEPG